MKYTLKLLWHGGILLGRVGWILGSAIAPFLIHLMSQEYEVGNEEAGMPERPSPADFNHPNWTYYYGRK
jgi:hypothetical protein